MRSASVDLPWSTWAMMEKLRMFRIDSGGMGAWDAGIRPDWVERAIVAYVGAASPVAGQAGHRSRAHQREASSRGVTAMNWVPPLRLRTSSITVSPALAL